ncbi:probable carboxylesterase 18 [Impatiens glandulifera]|uniref:probable carboxylesterase 18 n=1 Tax=Impatiens glandulifera TaxID=253017 RepID=UPI001FB18F4B|nr:probable carboxylesterase 18 [Impatiens glandulifera]
MEKSKISKSPSMPLKTRISLALLTGVTDAACRRDGTVNRGLINFFKQVSPANKTPVNGVKTADITVDPERNLWFRVFIPTDSTTAASLPVIVFFHGGGFMFLSADTKHYDAVCRRFAREIGAIVVSVNYRLTPENPYPAQYDDGFDVLKFLDEEDEKIENADLSRCFLAGDSAGGNIAHHVAKRFSENNFQRLKVIGMIAIQPFFGGEERLESELRLSFIVNIKRTDFVWKALLPHEGRDHEVINVSGPRAVDISALSNFPPVMVVIGGLDGLQDRQRNYCDWLKKNNKEVKICEFPTMFHAFYLFPEVPESTQLISNVKEFVIERLSSHANN